MIANLGRPLVHCDIIQQVLLGKNTVRRLRTRVCEFVCQCQCFNVLPGSSSSSDDGTGEKLLTLMFAFVFVVVSREGSVADDSSPLSTPVHSTYPTSSSSAVSLVLMRRGPSCSVAGGLHSSTAFVVAAASFTLTRAGSLPPVR
eukprot:m.639332 g.639332  ORF g.639332 m.639332 type:complete len:144 (-) comp22613_c0_seq5:2398-2829(-)